MDLNWLVERKKSVYKTIWIYEKVKYLMNIVGCDTELNGLETWLIEKKSVKQFGFKW